MTTMAMDHMNFHSGVSHRCTTATTEYFHLYHPGSNAKHGNKKRRGKHEAKIYFAVYIGCIFFNSNLAAGRPKPDGLQDTFCIGTLELEQDSIDTSNDPYFIVQFTRVFNKAAKTKLQGLGINPLSFLYKEKMGTPFCF